MKIDIDIPAEHTTTMTRRSLLAGLGATFAAPSTVLAVPGPKASRARRLFMTSIHTHESIDITYFRNGTYDRRALQAINHFLRDWRSGEAIEMDVQSIDLWSDIHRQLCAEHPFQLISGYRSPKTNTALRKASSGVAKKSYHMSGKAADLRLPNRSLRKIARAASQVGAGGIGIYNESNFVHIDTGPARSWHG
jgi:uncharacterized protein YcbK (DUF882 family)